MSNSPWYDDVLEFEGNVLVDMYETRYQEVCQPMLAMSTDKGHVTKASGTITTIANVKREVGRHYNGICYRLSLYNKGKQFDMGNN